MAIEFTFVDAPVERKQVGRKGVTAETQELIDAIKQLPINRPFKYENPTTEDGKVKRMDGVYRSALKHLAATNDIHEPSQQPFSNLHFTSGEAAGNKVLVLLVGPPASRGKKEAAAEA